MTNSSERLAVQHHLELVRAAIEIQEKRLLQVAAAIRGGPDDERAPREPSQTDMLCLRPRWATCVLVRSGLASERHTPGPAPRRRCEVEHGRTRTGVVVVVGKDAFVGRDRELQELEAGLEDARSGRDTNSDSRAALPTTGSATARPGS